MNIIQYINNPLKTASNDDRALEILNTKCSGYYITDTPTKDSILLKERFGIDTVLVDNMLYFSITEEIVNLNEQDTLYNEIESIGLKKEHFII